MQRRGKRKGEEKEKEIEKEGRKSSRKEKINKSFLKIHKQGSYFTTLVSSS